VKELPNPARHFFALPPAVSTDPASRVLVIARLLEDGDRSDLAWLARELGREAIATFVREHGGRKLSARSRRFWSRALALPVPPPHPLAEALWPLA
jgi:hypothetical protein